MHRSSTKRAEAKRMDALLGLPLDRYRRALSRLSADELAALEARLGVQRMKHGLARGGFGVERHRARQALALLGRREAALRDERAARAAAPPVPIQLLFPASPGAVVVAEALEQQAA